MDIIPSGINTFLAEQKDAYAELEEVIEEVIKGVRGQSKRVYRHDGRSFGAWLVSQQLTPQMLKRSHMRNYHEYLDKLYKGATAQRMWSVARKILSEYVALNLLASNPMGDLKGFSVENETTHTVLRKPEAEDLLSRVDRAIAMGKRDYALLQVLLRTGLRRFETAGLVIGDMRMVQGHYVLEVTGKGDKRANVKLPVDVYRHIADYLEVCGIQVDVTRPADRDAGIDTLPLFFGFKKGDKPSYKPITPHQIYRIVLRYAHKIGSDVTPHGLRATLITYLLDEGVPLHKVQYAARHKKPETTERYHVGKENLDDSALDRFHL